MQRIAKKLKLMKGTLVEVCQENDNLLLNSYVCKLSVKNSLKMKLETLNF